MESFTSQLLPSICLLSVTVLSLIVLLIHSLKKDSEDIQFWVSIVGLAGCIGAAAWRLPEPTVVYNEMLLTGGYASVFSILFCVATILTLLLSRDYLKKIDAHYGEYYSIMLFTLVGMIAFASALDLSVTFVGLELMSVCLYILAGFTRKVRKSNEAAMKYFLLGAFSTGFLLYGIALIYGTTGTTTITTIIFHLDHLLANTLFLVGCGLLLIGLAFKVAAVPFHLWVPDVYEGSPTSITAFMSTGAKSAAFGALALIFTAILDMRNTDWNIVVAILASASMILGNVVAIAQTNIKRMLAYSSIAHAGYLLIGITAGSPESITGIIFYLISYTLTNLGAFGIVSVLENESQAHVDLEAYKGLGKSKPLLAILMSVFMFSLAGIPPFSGFFGKYFIFYAAVQQGWTWLVILGVLTSVVSVYFYLRIVVLMYFQESIDESLIPVSRYSMVSHLISAIGVILFGLLPSLILNILEHLY